MVEKTVTISNTEYNKLYNDSSKFECLRSLGVDNWEGYSEAMALFFEEYEVEEG